MMTVLWQAWDEQTAGSTYNWPPC